MKKVVTYVVVVAIDDEEQREQYFNSVAEAERHLGKGNVRVIERIVVTSK